jgi:hypothetical protein
VKAAVALKRPPESRRWYFQPKPNTYAVSAGVPMANAALPLPENQLSD